MLYVRGYLKDASLLLDSLRKGNYDVKIPLGWVASVRVFIKHFESRKLEL